VRTARIVVAMDDDNVEAAAAGCALTGRRRERDSVHRTLRLTPRFSAAERAKIELAAAAVGMTVNGFAAEAVLAAARKVPVSYTEAVEGEALAQLQRQLFQARTSINRFGGLVNQAVARLHTLGQPPNEALTHATGLCTRAVQNMDLLINELHQRLRRTGR
jgi:uncharacterized protein (DUF1778 family)